MPRRTSHQQASARGGERGAILLVERLVASALATLPEPLRSAADELIFVVEGRAAREGRDEHVSDKHRLDDGEIYGLFEGMPRGLGEGYGELPPRITLFALPLVEDFGDDEGTLAVEIRRTIVHEIGHYLGLDEADLHRRDLE